MFTDISVTFYLDSKKLEIMKDSPVIETVVKYNIVSACIDLMLVKVGVGKYGILR